MEDITVRRLSKKVFPYLWLRHKLMSSIPSTGIFPFSEMTVFSQAIGNAAIVYLHMYRPVLSHYLEKHIPSMPQSKMQYWIHVAFLCLQARLATDNVFDYFLTVCSITAEVALHCYINGYEDVLPQASVFFCAFFESELHHGFHDAGGWHKLYRYSIDTSCPELYDMVDPYIKKIESPSDHLPILITIKNEHLAAERREKFLSLRSLKFGEIERDDQTKALVGEIFYWDFSENQRISELKPGILKRRVNLRRKKNKSNPSIGNERSDNSTEADEVPDATDGSEVDKLLCLQDETHASECATTKFKNKDEQAPNDLTDMKEENNQLCSRNEISGKTKLRASSSLRDICNFYESLSTQSGTATGDSKSFRADNGRRHELKSSAAKEIPKISEENYFKRYSRFVPHAFENVTPETAIKSTDSFHADALSEFTKSFQQLGFNCLCVGSSSNIDEKSVVFSNYAEIIEKCRYFKNKYSSIQFAVLIPNDYFGKETSRSSGTENFDEMRLDKRNNKQLLSNITEVTFNNGTSSPRLQLKKEKVEFVNNFDKNPIMSPIDQGFQNYSIESGQKSTFARFNERHFTPRDETLKIASFSDTRVDENGEISGNTLSLIKSSNMVEAETVSRFRVTKVPEIPSENETIVQKNWTNNTTKISRFTVTKISENQSKDEAKVLGKNWTGDAIKVSRFTVTKVNEDNSKNKTSTLGKNWTNEASKISRFTVTKVNESGSNGPTSILRKISSDETLKISRFSVTKVDDNKTKNPTSILRKKWKNETINKSRFSVKRIDDHELSLKTVMGSMGKSYPINTTVGSRFSVTKADESRARLSERNDSLSSETSDDTENEMVHFQNNGSVRYEKRVSFAEHPLISYYHTYSSDESNNSRESLNQISSENPQTLRRLEESSCQGAIPKTPSRSNLAVSDKPELSRRHSFSEGQSSSNNTGKFYNMGRTLLEKIFRRSSFRESKVIDSPTKEAPDQKIEELTRSLEAAGVEKPVVFKI